MEIVQDTYFIPDDIVTGLATGLYRRIGSVIRYAKGPNKGQIVKHLKSVDLKPVEPVYGVGVKPLQFVKQNKKGTIIALASVATVGTVVWIYNKTKDHEPKIIMEFRNALSVYIDAIRKGNMDVDKINNLMNNLEMLKVHKDYEKISIQLTTEELEILVGRIYESTIKLAKDNQVELTEEELYVSNKKNENIIINLQTCLKAQKHIFEEVA